MKKILGFLLLILLAGGFFVSCDVIDEPYIEDASEVWNGRKILILDFTGHHCPNCPTGHRTLEQLQESFPEVIVPVAVHGTYFARFITDTSKPFHYDFTTPTGLELAGDVAGNPGYFDIVGLPVGAVNSLVSEQTLSPGCWASEIVQYLSKYPEFDIEITNEFLTSDSIKTDVVLTSEIASDRNLSLCVYIVESDIIHWQEDNSAEISPVDDYEHNHVLRGSLNGTFGNDVNTGNSSISIGEEIEESYTLKLGDDWIPENCHIVAFVYDTDTKEVLQAEESELISE